MQCIDRKDFVYPFPVYKDAHNTSEKFKNNILKYNI